MEKKPKKINFDDQILQLPEELVHRILCCLPMKDLVRTSILSKRWEKTWIACGMLQFNCRFFERFYFCRASEEEINAKREELMEFVERTLHSCYTQMVSINNLKLSPTFYNSKTATFLDRCIGHAIGCNVRKLDIYNASPGKFMYYNLPQTVLAAKSITELSLGRCSLGSSACSNIDMPCLKILYLRSVCIGDHTIQNLLANFPVIEKLILHGECSTSKGSLKIFSLVNPKLVMVEIDNRGFERVEIEAMGLQSFCLVDDSRDISCSPPCELNISACKNMRTLELQGDTISEKMINYNLSKLCLLETLKIRKCNKWKTIKISSCRLKELEVIDCEKLVKVELIDHLNLTSFTYQGNNMISFSSDGLALSRADLSLYPTCDDFIWYLKLTEFFGQPVKVLKLHSTCAKSVIIPKEIREVLVSPLCNVEHLILDSYQKLQTQAVEEIVDGFLWVSLHPLTLIISFETYKENYETLGLKFLYNKEINNDGNPCCCSSLRIRCWRHSLAEIKMECSEGVDDEDKKNIRSFLDKKILNNIGGVTN